MTNWCRATGRVGKPSRAAGQDALMEISAAATFSLKECVFLGCTCSRIHPRTRRARSDFVTAWVSAGTEPSKNESETPLLTQVAAVTTLTSYTPDTVLCTLLHYPKLCVTSICYILVCARRGEMPMQRKTRPSPSTLATLYPPSAFIRPLLLLPAEQCASVFSVRGTNTSISCRGVPSSKRRERRRLRPMSFSSTSVPAATTGLCLAS